MRAACPHQPEDNVYPAPRTASPRHPRQGAVRRRESHPQAKTAEEGRLPSGKEAERDNGTTHPAAARQKAQRAFATPPARTPQRAPCAKTPPTRLPPSASSAPARTPRPLYPKRKRSLMDTRPAHQHTNAPSAASTLTPRQRAFRGNMPASFHRLPTARLG